MPKAECWPELAGLQKFLLPVGKKELERGQTCTEDALWQLTQSRGRQVEISDLSWRKLLKESQPQASAQNKTRPLLYGIKNLKDTLSIRVIFLVTKDFYLVVLPHRLQATLWNYLNR